MLIRRQFSRMRLITSNYLTKFVEQVLSDKDGLFTGAKLRWETRSDSAYRETLHASCEMEIENQNKIMNKHTHIDRRCQSVTINLAIGDRFVGYHLVGYMVDEHSLYICNLLNSHPVTSKFLPEFGAKSWFEGF